MTRVWTGILVGCLAVVVPGAMAGQAPVDVTERARGAKKVMLAAVTDVESAFDENEFGDRLIISRVALRVLETMKGAPEGAIVVTVEGGTVGDLTLEVSDMPQMTRGERAVVFLEDGKRGGYVPHGRGAGVLTLDADDGVAGTDLTLDDIRAAVTAAQAQGNR